MRNPTSTIWEVSEESDKGYPRWWTSWVCKYNIVDYCWALKMSLMSLWDSLITPSGRLSTAGTPRMMIVMDRGGLSSLYAADRMLKNMQRISMVLLVAVLVFVTSSGLNNEIIGHCPKECQCYNLQVDCSERGLHSVPKGIPRNVEKM